ncbi:hypothetical protein CEXT_240211 [Caerostris extrusa]|uniref:Uncharacterized protein n=1 Tax=Caerostris extrusa TaxID=172846 RepID=A0AAV4PST8_CAEEX|nr:hypothetical protein CEXT_240211 [Caerostris extrusa]
MPSSHQDPPGWKSPDFMAEQIPNSPEFYPGNPSETRNYIRECVILTSSQIAGALHSCFRRIGPTCRSEGGLGGAFLLPRTRKKSFVCSTVVSPSGSSFNLTLEVQSSFAYLSGPCIAAYAVSD